MYCVQVQDMTVVLNVVAVLERTDVTAEDLRVCELVIVSKCPHCSCHFTCLLLTTMHNFCVGN